MIRKPAVKGTFYPANPKEIEEFIRECNPKKTVSGITKGALIPHAGYLYSGKLAVETVSNLTPKKYAVIMGPNHTGRGYPFSVYTENSWQTPLGKIQVYSQFAKELTKENHILKNGTHAHTFEHSIEVILPILQHFFEEFQFVPIICASADLETCKKIAARLYQTAKDLNILQDITLIASSDMTHFEPLKQAKIKDQSTIDAILNLDAQNLLEKVKEENISMCGVIPVVIMLEFFKLTGVTQAKLIKYYTSGDVNKDYSSVVGYAGIVFK